MIYLYYYSIKIYSVFKKSNLVICQHKIFKKFYVEEQKIAQQTDPNKKEPK